MHFNITCECLGEYRVDDEDARCCPKEVKMLLAGEGGTECIQGKSNVTVTLFLSFYFLWSLD